MATTESVVKMLNSRLRELYDFFGYQSVEYNELKSILHSNFTGDNKYIVRQKGKPVRLSRSKEALEHFNNNETLQRNLDKVHDYLLNPRNRFINILSRYADEIGIPPDVKINRKTVKEYKEEILKQAESEYKALYNDDDLYTEIYDEINSNTDTQYIRELRDARSHFWDKPGQNNLKGMEDKYQEIQDLFDRAKENYAKRMGKKPEDSKNKKDPYDLGVNK